jgi:Transposase
VFDNVTCNVLIMIEASSSAYPSGMLAIGNQVSYGGDPRRCSTNPHPFYCGIDVHARSMSVCLMSQDGAILLHRHMQAAPEPCLKAMAPYRDNLVVAVACLFPWSWLAELWAQAGMPCVLGPALSMKAIHGGKATNDTLASHKIAALLRGGRRPQASVYPAEMRATRALWRRRLPRMRNRAALLAHVHNTTRH